MKCSFFFSSSSSSTSSTATATTMSQALKKRLHAKMAHDFFKDAPANKSRKRSHGDDTGVVDACPPPKQPCGQRAIKKIITDMDSYVLSADEVLKTINGIQTLGLIHNKSLNTSNRSGSACSLCLVGKSNFYNVVVKQDVAVSCCLRCIRGIYDI